MDLIGLIASINAIIIAFLLVSKKDKSISDKILIAWILNFALQFAIPFIVEHNFLWHKTYWGLVLGIVLVAHTPFLYVYTSSLTKRNFTVNLKTLSNFGVVLIYVVAFIPLLSLSPEDRLQMISHKEGIAYQAFLPLFTLLFCQVYFLIRTVILLTRHQYNIRNEFSHLEKINLIWIKHIVYGFALIIGLSFIAYALVSAEIISLFQMDISIIFVNIILFFYIAFYGYKQQAIFQGLRIPSTKEKDTTGTGGTGEPVRSFKPETTSELSEKGLDEIIQRLKTIMSADKVFLNPELNIGDLSHQLGIPAHQLSKLLNNQLNKNFFEFVNEYRIEEFKKLAANPKNKHISILGLALDAGFNSKATFNRIFKNGTGLTPSEFRESYKF